MTTPSTDSLKAAPATRPVEIDLAEPISSAPEISLGRGLPEGVQRVLAGVLLVPGVFMLLIIRLRCRVVFGAKVSKKMQNDDIEKKRKELELMLSVEHQMSDTSKNRLILKLLDLLEAEIDLD